MVEFLEHVGTHFMSENSLDTKMAVSTTAISTAPATTKSQERIGDDTRWTFDSISFFIGVGVSVILLCLLITGAYYVKTIWSRHNPRLHPGNKIL